MNRENTQPYARAVSVFALLLIFLISLATPGAAAPRTAAERTSQAVVISWTGSGFSPREVYIQPGQSVIFRNQSGSPLELRAGFGNQIFLPAIAGGQTGRTAAPALTIANPPALDATIQAGSEQSVPFGASGVYPFHNAAQSASGGVVHVAQALGGSDLTCPAAPGAGSGTVETELPKLLYASDEGRILLRWYWADCASAAFEVYRSAAGQPESLLATVAPQTDAATAEALLNSADPRWPDLSARAAALILQEGDFRADPTRTGVDDLFAYLYSNGLAAVHLTNHYYPLALMLGWGYVDTAVTPGVDYTYRVVAPTGGPGGAALELGSVKVSAGQRTPLAPPTGLTVGQLDIESWEGNWGRYQRNRRYDSQIYLDWAMDSPATAGGALVIGYDVFRALAVDEAGRLTNGAKVADINAGDEDALVVPGPNTTEGVDYLFRYNPGDYAQHTLCVGPRDLLNQPIRWPQDAAQCSDPVTIAATDYLPPVAPQNVTAEAIDNSTQVNLAWEHPNAGDVARFVIQRSKEMHCTAGACWTDVATVAGDQFAWSDGAAPCANDPFNPEGCWYRVVARDSAGNRSAPSQAAYAIIHDTQPPSQLDIFPTTCANPADPENSRCVNIVSDAVSLRLNCRFSPDGEELFLTDIDAADFLGLDWVATIKSIYRPPLHLKDVACRVILSDEYGNLTGIDDFPAFFVDIDADSPDQLAQPIITQIESIYEGPGNWAATIEWEMAAHPLLGSFVVERQHDGVTQNSIPIDPAKRSFTDLNVAQGEQYTYRVHALPATGDVNETVSEPRSQRILPGADRPLTQLAWVGVSPAWNAQTATASLLVDATSVAPEQIIHYAVFRSTKAASDFAQITPVLQATGTSVFYQDASAQRGCYWYVVVTFRTRDGEPTGYTEPRQPGACSQPTDIHTPGPVAAAPAFPLANCRPAVHTDAPAYNLRFGGGFQVALEGINENFPGPTDVRGSGWLLMETGEETIPVPMNFSGLTVNADGYVCSGTAQVDLSSMPGGGLWLQAPGGWPYQLIGITLRPWFGSQNWADATLDIFTGDAFTVGAAVGDASQRLRVTSARLLNSLRFTRTIVPVLGGAPCTHPSLRFRLETLPLDVIPTGVVQMNEMQITTTAACTAYVDRYNPAYPLVTSPYSGAADTRFANERMLAAQMTGGAASLTPAGLDANFSTGAATEWYASYPFAFHVQAAAGLSVGIADGHILSGTVSSGSVRVRYHQAVDSSQQAIVQGSFANLTIGPNGHLSGAVALPGVDWDAFAVPAAGWDFYQGPLTTPGLPASHSGDVAQAVMWASHPTSAAPVPVPDGVLPGEMEPGFNRRQAGASLAWANCGDTALFENVAVDAYLRRSGMTQRHIPLYSAESKMQVHGYTFRPERFDLHFLDNSLLDSDIRGYVYLPFPSDVDLHLVDIWLTGNLNDASDEEAACIGGGTIPKDEQAHTLAYWQADARFAAAEFRQTVGQPTILWLLGDLVELPHLTVDSADAALPAELAFDPDGNFHDDPASGPKYDRPDYRFQGFPYLLERFRLSDWYSAGSGEAPVWTANATTVAAPPAATWNDSGFIGLAGVPVAPYFGPVMIEAGAGGDTIVLTAWDAHLTGFASQPRVSKEWVKLARVNISFDYDHLLHVYNPADGTGLFAGFRDYRFVPDHYLEIPGVPAPVVQSDVVANTLKKLQILQLDTGVVISPTGTGVYLGLSAGVAPLRALAQAQAIEIPTPEQFESWSDKMGINATAKPVYRQQYQTMWNIHGPFSYENTTAVLDELSDLDLAHLLDVDNVGGRTQGLLADRGVNIRRLRGLVQMEGEGLEAQFKRFHLSIQAEIKGRNQNPAQFVPLPPNPAVQPEPPLFYAERMTLAIERHGDFMLVAKNVQSSKFNDKLDSLDATLIVNSTKPQFEGGLTLYGLKSGGVTIDNGSAVLGVGKEMNYVGLSFDGRMGAGNGEILIGGDLLAGHVDPESEVLQNNFADAMAEIEADLQGELVGEMTGFYLRAYAGQIPIIGNGCVLSLQADAELAFWYWQLAGPSTNFGGILSPAVYGRVLCLVDARGDLFLRYQQVDGADAFTGEGYIAGGVGSCDPSSWGDWPDRWWGDGGCIQAGAGLAVDYAEGDGWEVSYSADYERLFGD